MNKVAQHPVRRSLSSPAYAADNYTIDPNHTWPIFEVNHLGYSTQRGRFEQNQRQNHHRHWRKKRQCGSHHRC